MSKKSAKKITESFAITLVLIVVFLGTALLGQVRQVDQGKGGTTTAQVWLVKICDSAGANCGTVAIPVSITGTLPVTGTVQANAGTGTFNDTFTNTAIQANQGAAANATAGWPVISGVVTATTAALTSASPLDSTIGVSTKGYGTVLITLNPSGSITGGQYLFEASDDGGATYNHTLQCIRGDIAPAGVFTSLGASTVKSWTTCPTRGFTNVRARLNPQFTNTGTSNIAMQAANFSHDPFIAAYLQAGGNTVGAVKEMALSATDTTASTAQGSDVRVRSDKWGDIITAIAPPDMQSSARAALTSTTASSMFSAPGANYRYAITFMSACNLSSTIAGQIDITDTSGTIYSFPWTQTSSAPGEDRCIIVALGDGDPIYTAANSTISAKASVANGTGFTVNVALHKTGT